MTFLLKIPGQITLLMLVCLIWAYRLVLKPFLLPACRFHPSCSEYALLALQAHGPLRGSWLTFRRLLRCHPWGDMGYDPVPETPPCCTKGTGEGNAPVLDQRPY